MPLSWPDLYRVDLDSGKKERIAKGSARHRGWVVGGDGAVVANAQYHDETGLWQLYAGNNHEKLLFEKTSMLGKIDLIGQGHSAGTVLFDDDEKDDASLIEFSVVDKKQEQLCDKLFRNEYVVDPDTGRLLGRLGPRAPYAMLFDARLQARFDGARKAFPAYQMRLESFSRNLDRLIVFTDVGDDSGTCWRVDIATGRADPIGRAYPEIDPADVGPTSVFAYKSSDEWPIEAVLTLPPGRKARDLPVVVLLKQGGRRVLPIWWHFSIGKKTGTASTATQRAISAR
ncbi:MAG: hypothetical protein EXR85_04940 [Xanthomonadales bacterium]|nr:hypothetical protein [Xanthomonadales bacterium]